VPVDPARLKLPLREARFAVSESDSVALGLLGCDLGSDLGMEALKFLAGAFGFAVAFAAVVTFLVGLAIEPLERMRLRWLGREREAAKIVSA
jgi:hypothetical protein